jgi:hypothetical protein
MKPTDEQKEVAEKRLETCKSCEHIKLLEGFVDFYYCGKCSCPLNAKFNFLISVVYMHYRCNV